MAEPRSERRCATLPPPPWTDLLHTALGGVYPAELRLEEMIDLLEDRK